MHTPARSTASRSTALGWGFWRSGGDPFSMFRRSPAAVAQSRLAVDRPFGTWMTFEGTGDRLPGSSGSALGTIGFGKGLVRRQLAVLAQCGCRVVVTGGW